MIAPGGQGPQMSRGMKGQMNTACPFPARRAAIKGRVMDYEVYEYKEGFRE